MIERPLRRFGVFAERAAWTFGIACLVTYGALYVDSSAGARHELARFAILQAAALEQPSAPDMSLWDPERVAAWRGALNEPAPPPLAVLRIPKIRLEVPILQGTDDVTLNRAVGHIDDTALPGGGRQLRDRRAPRRVLSRLEGHRARRHDRARNASREGGLSRRTDLGCQPGRRIRARDNPHAVAHARDMLPVLLRRPGAATLHRPRGAHRHGRDRSPCPVSDGSGPHAADQIDHGALLGRSNGED